ncbi:hypothetical protein, partial [Ideonella sp. B508-1]|uniref:hypothetical protein n=1 Tax=Ideonella sp. B508-1 TaxID=137716 RepID=UPI001F3679E0
HVTGIGEGQAVHTRAKRIQRPDLGTPPPSPASSLASRQAALSRAKVSSGAGQAPRQADARSTRPGAEA